MSELPGMPPSMLRGLLRLSPSEASLDARGFSPCDATTRQQLERVLETFVLGYNAALEAHDPEELAQTFRERWDAHHVGFAFEGAGMYYGIRDLLTPWRPSRLCAFVEGAGSAYDYIATVGAGLALAHLPWGLRLWPSYSARLDPLVAWCLLDGYGFHQGLFDTRRFVALQRPAPQRLPEFARALFDAGLGRSLWWSEGARPERIAHVIGTFPHERRAEMWSGIGTAAAYAGGVDDGALLRLRQLAGPYLADLLSGVPFATRMRQKGGNPSAVTERACSLLLGCTAEQASDVIVEVLAQLLSAGQDPGGIRRRDIYLLVRTELVRKFEPTTQDLAATASRR